MIENAFLRGFVDEIRKEARKVVHFAERDVPAKSKEIYKALKRPTESKELKERYGERAKEVRARIALAKGKKASALEILSEILKTG
jgi:hypothetical protein